MQVEDTPLPGVKLLTPKVFGDERGFFMETFNQRTAAGSGIPSEWVQDNHSYSQYGVLRGLHYQYPTWQGKLVRVVLGEIFDVAVDIRRDSATFGQWFGARLSGANKQQLYVPEGFAHGFCVTSGDAHVLYKCTSLYRPDEDAGVLWNDPDIGIQWPVDAPILSDKDANAPRLNAIRP
ncbi:MAG: dTDP-4-dehydrorhamnose 3,5-epimerase [Gammaproteobacteria bacterium]|nr:dTDP-4-dehydrorhamnose 3,5-epimerase [Gammaproteobacteria bacterium]